MAKRSHAQQAQRKIVLIKRNPQFVQYSTEYDWGQKIIFTRRNHEMYKMLRAYRPGAKNTLQRRTVMYTTPRAKWCCIEYGPNTVIINYTVDQEQRVISWSIIETQKKRRIRREEGKGRRRE